MAIIFAENFSSPVSEMWDSLKWGANDITYPDRWYSGLVPYVATDGYPGELQQLSLPIGSGSIAAKRLFYFEEDERYINLFMKHSTNIVVGACFQFMLNTSSHRTPGTYLKFVFSSYLEGSSTKQDNFTVNIALDPVTFQSATVSFTTGGSGHPSIAPETIYRDFADTPTWFWVQCDMDNADTQQGVCRVWIGDDLVVTRDNIYTGDYTTWAAQPHYAKNNACTLKFRSNAYYGGRYIYVYGLAATNEDLSYMDTALGDIAISTVPASTLGSSNQWSAVNADGTPSDDENAEILADNTFIDLESTDSLDYVEGSEHMARDLHQHEHPFHLGADIKAVAHTITHKKTVPPGDTSKYRIEPVYHVSGRAVEYDRSKGQVVQTYPQSFHAFYTTPYAGAYWTEEILGLSRFGYMLYSYAEPELVVDGYDLLPEMDVIPIEETFDMADDASVGDVP